MRRAWAIRLRSNETAIVAGGCRPEDADALAARLAAAYRGLDLSAVTGDPDFRLSASIAVAAWPRDCADLRDLVEQAYGLMTRAWKDGGDRIYKLKSAADAEAGAGARGGSADRPAPRKPEAKRDSPEAKR